MTTLVSFASSATAIPANTGAVSSPPMLHRSPSSTTVHTGANTGLRPPMPPSLKIPDLDSLTQTPTMLPVPFPRISQRRKLYRGVGTQPWHHKASDSDSDSDESPVVRRAKQQHHHQSSSTTPSPEATFDPKRTYSESQLSSTTQSSLTAFSSSMIRKKSGEVVKSALKSPSQSSFGSASSSRISLPPTPTTDKSVHFDNQLEYVKLFNHKQRPTAVSREGSPCESETSDNDTLGQQSDAFQRSSEDERIRKSLVMESVNIPLRNAMASTQERLGDLDIRLDQVVLAQDGRAVEGTVLVRNIAYEKWIAVRFTYDWWQTTSEVTAKYSESFPDENTDLFSFTIRLPEVTKRIEEKRLQFALRYKAGGRECWDNNRGENYHLRFKTETKRPQIGNVTKSGVRPPSWPMHSSNDDQMAELRKELEKVVRDDEESSGVHAWDLLTVKLRARNMDIEEDRDVKKGFNNNNLTGRYDFNASSKVRWEAPKDLPKYGGPPPETAAIPFPSAATAAAAPGRHTRSVSASAVSTPSSTSVSGSGTLSLQLHQASWRSPRGSPRDHGTDSTASSPKFFIDPREAKHWKGPAGAAGAAAAASSRVRNHQRGGYFDSYMEGLSKAILTPPTSYAPHVDEDDSVPIDLTASTSVDSAITITATNKNGDMPNVVAITEDTTELSSETESTSSSTSSSHVTPASIADASVGLSNSTVEQARAMRFNSYPMDRMHLAVTAPSPSPEGPPSIGDITSGMRQSLLGVPQQTIWPLSPQGSSSSVISTPSITSASSPSQCPSSPAELSDSMPSIHQLAPGPGVPRPKVDSLDYDYLLRKFCYFTGNNVPDRHGLHLSYGSIHHRHSQSESTMDGHSPSWDATRVVGADSRRHSLDNNSPPAIAESRAAIVTVANSPDFEASLVINDDVWPTGGDARYESGVEVDRGTWSSESGHTTPTLSPKLRGTFSPYSVGSPGKQTPTQRAASPTDLETTPRMQADYFVRPYRGSL